MFYECTALSSNKAAMLIKGEIMQPGDELTPEVELTKTRQILELRKQFGKRQMMLQSNG